MFKSFQIKWESGVDILYSLADFVLIIILSSQIDCLESKFGKLYVFNFFYEHGDIIP